MKITIARDPVREIRKYVDAELENAGDTYIIGILAAKIVERLRDDDPQLLAQFLDAHATNIVSKMVGDVARSQRAHIRARAGRRIVAEAIDRYEEGDTYALSSWQDMMYVVNTDATRKRLGDMVKEDLVWAAEDYAGRAQSNMLQSAFLKALANRVGARTVGEVYTDEQIARMWQGLQ